MAQQRRTAAVVIAAVLCATLATIALWPRHCHEAVEPIPQWTAGNDRSARTADCFAALESAAVALEIHRAERGTYPTDWTDLVPTLLAAAPTDPFRSDGGPLSLVVPAWDEGSVLLYCVGPDGHDDGGRLYVPDLGRGDIVYLAR